MKYVEFVNETIRKKLAASKRAVVFGQNVDAGSFLSGLTRNFKNENITVINTPNSENCLCGVGFGLMLSGIDALFFMKQQDFLLLGADHLVNTYNFIRRINPKAAFTIVKIVSDSGFEGPQSGLNNFYDFCSIARARGFTITNNIDAEYIVNAHLLEPGFRMIGVSQRLFKQNILELDTVYADVNKGLFQYFDGPEVTIACFNFSLPLGLELYQKLKENKISASLFSVNAAMRINWDRLISNLQISKRLVLIDDSKSLHCAGDDFLIQALERCDIKKKIVLKRDLSDEYVKPGHDQLLIDYDDVAKKLKSI